MNDLKPSYLQSFLSFFTTVLTKRWRSLLLLFVGVAVPLLIFEQLAAEIWRSQGGFAWDQAILMAIHNRAQPRLDRVASVLTHFGTYWGVFPATIAIAAALLAVRQWRSLAYWLTTMTGCMLINRTAKVLLHRVRPDLWLSPAPELDYSFPSGHAMSSMTFVVALVILANGTRWQWLLAGLGGGFVSAIGWTRLYLGVHFPSDILAGWMVSVAWAIGVSLLIRPNAVPSHLPRPSELAISPSPDSSVDLEQP